MTDQKTAFTIDADYVEKVLKTSWLEKYDALVWAARKPPLDADEEHWHQFWNEDGRSTPIDIRTECLKQVKIISEKYPEEIEALKSPEEGDWEHGFNSGCLAMIRWFERAFDNSLFMHDDGVERPFGGIENANQEFPFLDT